MQGGPLDITSAIVLKTANGDIFMDRHRLSTIACAAVVATGFAAPTRASDNGITTTVSGYGTVAGTFTSSDKVEYTTSAEQFRGASNRLDIGLQSRLGVQAVVKFGPEFSFTGQALAKRRGDKDFDIGAEWLYGQYTPMPGLDLRLGRVVMPTFLLSDTRNVGFAAPWLLPPADVYAPMPYSTMDGIQASWRFALGSASVSTQVGYGAASTTVFTPVGTLDVHARDVVSAALAVEWGDWTARLANTRTPAAVSLPLGPGMSIDYINKDNFASAGVQYDNGTTIVMSEMTKRTENDVPGLGMPISATTNWYVALGWRFGKFTPMVRHVASRTNGSLISAPDQKGDGLSLRYDVARNVALKAQIDRYDASNLSAFKVPLTASGQKINVFSFGADFLF
jgi:hypothetical protein